MAHTAANRLIETVGNAVTSAVKRAGDITTTATKLVQPLMFVTRAVKRAGHITSHITNHTRATSRTARGPYTSHTRATG